MSTHHPPLSHKGTCTIETERLILRRFEPNDAEAMFRNWVNDPEVTRFLTWAPHGSIALTRKINAADIQKYEDITHYQWAIVPASLGEPIGGINVVRIDEPCYSLEIAYRIGKAWWHQGFAGEALSAVIKFLFEQVGANRITAAHDTRNQNSGAVMRKCGMFYEGTLRQSGCNQQGLFDAACYALLADEYFRSRQKEAACLTQPSQHPPTITYRRALLSDAPELLRLNDLFNGVGSNDLAAIEASIQHNEQEIVCVADDGEALLGFCCGQIFKSMCYAAHYGEITELFVTEANRRQGIAGGLMTYIESVFQTQGIHHFQLFTGGNNKIGQAFYNKQQYTATTEIMFRKQTRD